MKVLSLYCGAGGIDEGLKQAGIKTTLAVDVWKDATETMKLNHDCEVITGKVSDIKSTLGEFDMVVGGPPCPEFSRANKERTFNACEVNNFWDIVDNIAKPKHFIMENVQDVIKVSQRDNCLLDCADYGVPQNRLRRIYTNLPKPIPISRVTMRDMLHTKQDIYLTDFSFPNRNQKCVSRSLDEQCVTLTTMDCFYFTPVRIYTRKYLKDHEKVWLEKPAKTSLTNGMPCKSVSNHDKQLIQGFPYSYRFFGNVASVRKQICNAVPPPLIRSIASKILVPQYVNSQEESRE